MAPKQMMLLIDFWICAQFAWFIQKETFKPVIANAFLIIELIDEEDLILKSGLTEIIRSRAEF